MNIRNFITNIFSSSQKKQPPQPNESNHQLPPHENTSSVNRSNKSTSDRSEEDLLSNLRRSNLFFDDNGQFLYEQQQQQQQQQQSPQLSSSSLQKLNKSTNPAAASVPVGLIHIDQRSNSNASRDWEMKLVLPFPKESSTPLLPSRAKSIIPSSMESSAAAAAVETIFSIESHKSNENVEKRAASEVLTPNNKKGNGEKRNNQLLNYQDFINSLKKDKMEIDANTTSPSQKQQSALATSSNCIFFDRKSQQQLPVYPAFNVSTERIAPDFNPFQKKVSNNQFESQQIQDENNVLGKINASLLNGCEQASQTTTVMDDVVALAGNININNRSLQKQQYSKLPSRVRGSSSKKKEILLPSRSLANSSSLNLQNNASYNSILRPASANASIKNSKRGEKMIVEEDIQENVCYVSQDLIENSIFDLQSSSSNCFGTKQNKDMRDDLDDGYDDNQFKHQQSFFDAVGVSSTRAEPPTHFKNRDNNFFLSSDEDIPSKLESDQMLLPKKNVECCSDDGVMHVAEDACFELMKSTQSSQQSILREQQCSSQGKIMCVASASGLSDSANEMIMLSSNTKSRSNTSSPNNRVSLTSFHKQIEMMIDKSEILPHILTKSANKVPSPIKEVEECSQRNQKITPSRESKDEENHSACNPSSHCVLETEKIVVSPKLRQKSVKFEDVIATPLDSKENARLIQEEEEEDPLKISEADSIKKAHDKLQSRRPTPYNHFKSGSSSIHSRQQFNLANQEGESIYDHDEDDIELSDENGLAKATNNNNNNNTSSKRIMESRVLFRSDCVEEMKNEQIVDSQSPQIKLDSKINELPNSKTEEQSDLLLVTNEKLDSQVSAPVQLLNRSESTETTLAQNSRTEKKNSNTQRPEKLPLALKKSDFVAQMKAAADAGVVVPVIKKEMPKSNQRNNFFRSESSLCFTPFHHKSSDSRPFEQDRKSNEGIKSHGSSNTSINGVTIESKQHCTTAVIAASRREQQIVRVGFENTNKRKVSGGGDEKQHFSDSLRVHTGEPSSGKGQKSFKEYTSASNPLPRKMGATLSSSSEGAAFMMRSTSIGIATNAPTVNAAVAVATNVKYHSNNSSMAMANPAKSLFKVCLICHFELKSREESKVFSCCHKAHIKEKSTKCPRCNSMQLSYKE